MEIEITTIEEREKLTFVLFCFLIIIRRIGGRRKTEK